jgi:hypothetical protein
MRLRAHKKEASIGGVTLALGSAVLIGAIYVAVASIPEFVRYFRIRRM